MAKALKFKDTPARSVKLKKSDRTVFFVPHTSEQFAVLPFISKLTEELRKKGKGAKKELIEDMQFRILRTTSQLFDLKVSGKDEQLIEKLFKLEDAWVRLQKFNYILERYPEASILEMHALDEDYEETDKFGMAHYFYRLPDTRILVLRNILEEYAYPIREGLREMDEKNERQAAIIGCFSELVLAKVSEDYKKLLEVLSENMGRVAMVEIPAPSHATIRKTGIRFIDRLIYRSLGCSRPLTRFEENYGINFSLRTKVREEDVQGILKMISE